MSSIHLPHMDNGFSSAEGMAASHRVMSDAALRLLHGHTGKILDLGCGNGCLVAAIASRFQGVTPWGVECVPDRANRGRSTLERAGGRLYVSSIFSLDQPWFNHEPYLLTMLMIGRLIEVDVQTQRTLIRDIERNTRLLLLYTYGDSLSMSDKATRLLSTAFPGAAPMAGVEDGSLPRIWVYDVIGRRIGGIGTGAQP
ncbi:MAG: hypothetical protein WA738_15360 [Candidatus Angelobacter sp.]